VYGASQFAPLSFDGHFVNIRRLSNLRKLSGPSNCNRCMRECTGGPQAWELVSLMIAKTQCFVASAELTAIWLMYWRHADCMIALRI